jgi:hypothetical protein
MVASASRWVSWTTGVYTFIVTPIWEWPRISMTTLGGTPCEVNSVAHPCLASCRRMIGTEAFLASRPNDR